MSEPLLLDLCCGAGGCTEGYRRAGFRVVGVDNRPQPRYCGDDFVQADALALLRFLLARQCFTGTRTVCSVPGNGYYGLSSFDAIHASPPCQGYSQMPQGDAPRLIPELRALLKQTGLPYVIENVVGARKEMEAPILLCGWMFRLRTYRHRLFESNVFLLQPPHEAHPEVCPKAGKRRIPEGGFISVVGNVSQMRYARRVMGIDWMNRDELTQAVPPVYTECIGRQLQAHLRGGRP